VKTIGSDLAAGTSLEESAKWRQQPLFLRMAAFAMGFAPLVVGRY
jgi:hypothetical protein